MMIHMQKPKRITKLFGSLILAGCLAAPTILFAQEEAESTAPTLDESLVITAETTEVELDALAFSPPPRQRGGARDQEPRGPEFRGPGYGGQGFGGQGFGGPGMVGMGMRGAPSAQEMSSLRQFGQRLMSAVAEHDAELIAKARQRIAAGEMPHAVFQDVIAQLKESENAELRELADRLAGRMNQLQVRPQLETRDQAREQVREQRRDRIHPDAPGLGGESMRGETMRERGATRPPVDRFIPRTPPLRFEGYIWGGGIHPPFGRSGPRVDAPRGEGFRWRGEFRPLYDRPGPRMDAPRGEGFRQRGEVRPREEQRGPEVERPQDRPRLERGAEIERPARPNIEARLDRLENALRTLREQLAEIREELQN